MQIVHKNPVGEKNLLQQETIVVGSQNIESNYVNYLVGLHGRQ